MMHSFKPSVRNFIPKDLKFTWETLEPYYSELKSRSLNNKEDLLAWLSDRSEIDSAVSEDFAWRYIRMNVDTRDESLAKDFSIFVQTISPKISPFDHDLNVKFQNCEWLRDLNQEQFKIILRSLANEIKLFREENIPIFTKLEEESQEFGKLNAVLEIEKDGKKHTLQQASNFLKDLNRPFRKEIYFAIAEERAKIKSELNSLFDSLKKKRTDIAKNAGYDNFTSYKFDALGRFDYNQEDCKKFHEAIRESVMPKMDWIYKKRKDCLKIDQLFPWDLSVDLDGKPALKPFVTGDELLDKTIKCFNEIDPFFGDCIAAMKEKNHLDLDSKKGKAPGGFNYPLYESGLPFIYMNASGAFRDVTTMVHEGGHAIHSVLSHPLPYVSDKSFPSEVAELASMSMELISMDHWDAFFENEEDLKRAKRDQLIGALSGLPWIACIDKFQHWIYKHPDHSVQERTEYWEQLMNEFSSSEICWENLDDIKANLWQKQLHLFEVPFYYIEYGMAQLGAIAMWRNYRKNPKQTIIQYKAALSLGYTKSINEIYQTAGIQFSFNLEYVKELSDFLFNEIKQTFD